MLLGVNSINIGVTDMERSIAFYRDQVGLAFLFSDQGHGYARFELGGSFLGLVTEHADFTGRHTGIGLRVADIEAAHAELAGRGVPIPLPPTRQPWGALMAMFADPDGNSFYLETAQ
jgi:predicted enzyme related to lactoylglutathione lyase